MIIINPSCAYKCIPNNQPSVIYDYDICCYCLEKLESNLTLLQCGHVFHTECINLVITHEKKEFIDNVISNLIDNLSKIFMTILLNEIINNDNINNFSIFIIIDNILYKMKDNDNNIKYSNIFIINILYNEIIIILNNKLLNDKYMKYLQICENILYNYILNS